MEVRFEGSPAPPNHAQWGRGLEIRGMMAVHGVLAHGH